MGDRFHSENQNKKDQSGEARPKDQRSSPVEAKRRRLVMVDRCHELESIRVDLVKGRDAPSPHSLGKGIG